MNYILDTHIFIWYIKGDKKLSNKIKDIIQSKNNNIYLSVVSIWEIIIKYHLGKIDLPSPVSKYIHEKRILHEMEIIPIVESNLSYLETLPDIHKDPFDRLLISQALDYDITLLTDDFYIKKYTVRII